MTIKRIIACIFLILCASCEGFVKLHAAMRANIQYKQPKQTKRDHLRISAEEENSNNESSELKWNVIKQTLDTTGMVDVDGESSIYYGFLKRKSSKINPRAMSMETVESQLINLPSDERLRRFQVGDIAVISVLLFFALSSPPTLLSPFISLPFLYLSLGYVLSGKEGL